jgi:GTP-binding protein HflX
VQQRNLEKEWNAKVLDRTGLILEIFGRRAQTKEGSLQVELAHLNYQKGRLVRSWTHLERQRGGAGFLGGPGETQIEADRRILQDKIKKLERELESGAPDAHAAPFEAQEGAAADRVARRLHQCRQVDAVQPADRADVSAENMLFATLDPTLRRVRLPSGTWIILSDTVGFISDLPTHLVAAFRATLEEVQEADVVLHVRDMSSAATKEEAADVARSCAIWTSIPMTKITSSRCGTRSTRSRPGARARTW